MAVPPAPTPRGSARRGQAPRPTRPPARRPRSVVPWPGGLPRGGMADPGHARPVAVRPAGHRRRWRTSVAMLNASKNSSPDPAVTGIGVSSSVRRNALAAAARTSPRASWTAMSWSSAALSISGSPTRRASVRARSTSSAGGRIGLGAVERLGNEHPSLSGRVAARKRPRLGEQRLRLARRRGRGHQPGPTIDQLGRLGRGLQQRRLDPRRVPRRRLLPGAAASPRCRSVGSPQRPPRHVTQRPRRCHPVQARPPARTAAATRRAGPGRSTSRPT